MDSQGAHAALFDVGSNRSKDRGREGKIEQPISFLKPCFQFYHLFIQVIKSCLEREGGERERERERQRERDRERQGETGRDKGIERQRQKEEESFFYRIQPYDYSKR